MRVMIHRTKRLISSRVWDTGLHLEALESRCLLSVSAALGGDYGLTIDPGKYDPDSILVRFRDDSGVSAMVPGIVQSVA